jgi:hypothetical protein
MGVCRWGRRWWRRRWLSSGFVAHQPRIRSCGRQRQRVFRSHQDPSGWGWRPTAWRRSPPPWRMKAEPHDPGRSGWRISQHVRKICIQGNEDSSLFNGCGAHCRVFGSGEADIDDGESIVTQLAHRSRVQRRQILIQQELHASASTTSSAASAAAYPSRRASRRL